MKAAAFSGAHGFIDVKSYSEAAQILFDLGHQISKVLTEPIVTRSHYDGLIKAVTEGLFAHFFGPDGLEIGYYTHAFNTLLIFETPRHWSDKLLRNAENLAVPRDTNTIICEKCKAKGCFEKHFDAQPNELDQCRSCMGFFCEDCIDWNASGDNGTICKLCS